jgi:hypothetical protein
MPERSKQAHHIATEEQTMANIAWAKAQAMKAKSPDGLTTLAKSFWHTINKETK